MTMDGEIAWTRRANAVRSTASTIKMLNALVVRDIASLDTTITVTRRAAAIDEGDVGLRRGQKLTVRQLLQIMLVASANDAAEALAIGVGHTQTEFVDLMNAKARSLGLTRTFAVDPHGLGRRNVSTAKELSVLARAVMADPVLRSIVRKRSVRVPRKGGTYTVVKSTNHLLGVYVGMEGVKTGYTIPAGFCIVGAAKRGDVELLGMVLGAPTLKSRFTQMRKLLDWGFAHIHSRTLVSAEATLGPVPVANGTEVSVPVRPSCDATMTLFDGGGSLTTSISVPAAVIAPVTRGQQLGFITISRNGIVLVSVPLVADADVPLEQAPLAAFGR